MSIRSANPLSHYFGEMVKKPLRKDELKQIFDQLATRSATEEKKMPAKDQDENAATINQVATHGA